jgi:hypothetical protein
MQGMEEWRTKPDAILGNKLEASEDMQHARIDSLNDFLTCDTIFGSRGESSHGGHAQPPIRGRIICSAHPLALDGCEHKQVWRLGGEMRPRVEARSRFLPFLRKHVLLQPLIHRTAPEHTRKRHVGRHFLHQILGEEFPQRRVKETCGNRTWLPPLRLGLCM